MSTTGIEVELVDGRHRVRFRHGVLRGAQLHGPPDRARVALVGQTALLLGGDEVELDVRLGPGARLELSEVAGTIAYDGRGGAACWTTRIALDAGAELSWAGEPFVVSDGADVRRSTEVRLAGDAVLTLRETIVLGRSGQLGGRLRARTDVARDGRPLLIEDLLLEPAQRTAPGLVGAARVLDAILDVRPSDREIDPAPAGATRFALVEAGATLTRYLGREAAASPLRRPQLPAAMLAR